MAWPLVALKAQQGEANYWRCKNSNVTVVMVSGTSVKSTTSTDLWQNVLMTDHWIRSTFHSEVLNVDGEREGLKSFMQQTLQQLKRWPWRVWHEGQRAERVHSDTYIPVQPNLQPKPEAERTSGRKKERKHNSIIECQQKKQNSIQTFKVSLNRTCRRNQMILNRLNRKDTACGDCCIRCCS